MEKSSEEEIDRGTEKFHSRRWPNYVLLMLTVVLCLGILEFAARHLLPVNVYEIAPSEEDAQPIGIRHPTRVLALRPNFHGSFVHPDYMGEEVVTNSFGFRDQEPPSEKHVSALHITVLGDSLTFGMGVEADETFSAILERELADSLGIPVHVFNTGVPSYGALHQLVVLREEYERQLPDVAVVAFYTGNDLLDAIKYYHKRVFFDLLPHLLQAPRRTVRPENVRQSTFVIDNEGHPVLFAHPQSEIELSLLPEWIRPGAALSFGVTLDPKSWDKPDGDGVRFVVVWQRDGQEVILFDEHIDPQNQPHQRMWNYRKVDLSEIEAAGSKLIFRTTFGSRPGSQGVWDWGGWVTPHIFYPDLAQSLMGKDFDVRYLPGQISRQYRVMTAKRPIVTRDYWEKRSSFLRFAFYQSEQFAVSWGLMPPKG